MPLSVPGRSVARTQPAGYLMKNPALPTKGARSTGSARAFGAAIVLGRTIALGRELSGGDGRGASEGVAPPDAGDVRAG